MRTFLALLAIVCLIALAVGWWRSSSLFPKPSREIVQLDAKKRRALTSLKNETKFEAHDFPPFGYTGVATAEEGVVARRAVNGVIGLILSRGDEPISATLVSDWIGDGMKHVDQLETEDRARTAEYMVEIWYLLGFKGAVGRFAYGAAFQRPEGYEEPLPPGWKSPTEPRVIGDP